MAWRGVYFGVTGSIAAVFTDYFKIISGTGKYIRADLYAARNCFCTDGAALVNIECTAECTSGCRRCEFYIVCVINHNVVDPQCDFYNAFSFRPVVKSKNSCMISCFLISFLISQLINQGIISVKAHSKEGEILNKK